MSEKTNIWKVFVSTFGEDCDSHGWHTNAMNYPSKEVAERAGADLASRWMLVKDWKVREVPPNTFTDPDFKKVEAV